MGIITNIFTLIGVLLGFCLGIIYDKLKEKSERKNNRALIILKLTELKAFISQLKTLSRNLVEIKSKNELIGIRGIVDIVEADKEINEIKMLFTRLLPFNPEFEELYGDIIILNYQIKHLVRLIDFKFENNNDIKPTFISILDRAETNIDSIIEKVKRL